MQFSLKWGFAKLACPLSKTGASPPDARRHEREVNQDKNCVNTDIYERTIIEHLSVKKSG